MIFYSGLGGIVWLVRCPIGYFVAIFAMMGWSLQSVRVKQLMMYEGKVLNAHAILPLYMIKSGKTDIADVCTASYPSSFSVLTCNTNTADFCSIITTLHDMLSEEVNLPQLDDTRGVKTNDIYHTAKIDNISMTAGGGDWVKLYGIESFWRAKSGFGGGRRRRYGARGRA